jgi:hypothetical protein
MAARQFISLIFTGTNEFGRRTTCPWGRGSRRNGLEEVLARAVQVFLALAGAYLVALWFALIVWTYRDIGSRSQSVVTQVMATLMTVLFWVPGALLYLLLRPRNTLDEAFQRSLEEEYLLQDLEELPVCHVCNRSVADEYMLCPHCQTALRDACGACGKLISVRWPICPYCGSDQSGRAAAIRERVEPPAERFLERGHRTFRQLTAASVRQVAFPEAEIDARHQPELSAGDYGPAAAEQLEAEDQTPIRLFDRKRTRARKENKILQSSEPASTAESESDESRRSEQHPEKTGVLSDKDDGQTEQRAEFASAPNGHHEEASVAHDAESIGAANK